MNLEARMHLLSIEERINLRIQQNRQEEAAARAAASKTRAEFEARRPELLKKLASACALFAISLESLDPHGVHAESLVVGHAGSVTRLTTGTFGAHLRRILGIPFKQTTTFFFEVDDNGIASWYLPVVLRNYGPCYVTRRGDIVGVGYVPESDAPLGGRFRVVGIAFDDLITEELEDLLNAMAHLAEAAVAWGTSD